VADRKTKKAHFSGKIGAARDFKPVGIGFSAPARVECAPALPKRAAWFRFSLARWPITSVAPSSIRRIKAVPLAVCPECEAEIHVDEELDKGEMLNCEECEARLAVVGLDPIELDLVVEAEEEEEDEDEY
jgi:alpha-aminoadipate carrier protein LysW